MTPTEDASRFESTAGYYAKYRPGYASETFQYLIDRFALNDSHRVLDLGCGTGEIAIPLARHVGEVVGMDPNDEMLDHARDRAISSGQENIEWARGSDAELHEARGTFHMVTMGRSFHWMDQARTLRQLRGVIDPGGGIAILTDQEWLTRGRKDWQATVYSIIEEYLDDLPPRTGPVDYSNEDPWDELLAEFGFTDVAVKTFEFERRWDIDAVVGYVFSLSFCSPKTFGRDKEAFESTLRERLAALPSDGFVQEAQTRIISGRISGDSH